VARQELPGIEAWRRELLETLRGDASAPRDSVCARPQLEDDRLEALAFRLGPESFAIDIQAVMEIVLPRPVTALPRAPAFVRGVASLRGAMLPVVDLARRLGLHERADDRHSRILVVRDGAERMGFWTGHVLGVARLVRGELESTAFAGAVDPRFLEGLGYDRNGGLLALLNADRLCDFDLGM
jgi:purine-binding chemotaxis protein CheW